MPGVRTVETINPPEPKEPRDANAVPPPAGLRQEHGHQHPGRRARTGSAGGAGAPVRTVSGDLRWRSQPPFNGSAGMVDLSALSTGFAGGRPTPSIRRPVGQTGAVMTIDAGKRAPGAPRRRQAAWAGHSRRPLEQAQVVWQRTLELAGPLEGRDPEELALDLFRAARHDATTMAHALALGRARLADTDDADIAGGVGVLEGAVRFLGTRPERSDAAVAGPRR